MKRVFLYTLIILSLLVSTLPRSVSAQRYAVCDECGLCATNPSNITALPGNWKQCAACLYPTVDGNHPETLDTLKIDETTNSPILPAQPGRFYSAIGCITTTLSDFTQPGAAASLTRPLLNVLLSIGGAIAFLYLLYGGFLIVTSRGDAEQLNLGRRTIYGAIIGIVFALSSVFLVNLLASGVLKIPGFQ